MNNNRISEIRPADFIQGINSPLKFKAVTDGNWIKHLWFAELQEYNGTDTDGCEFFTGQESFDAQMDALWDTMPVGLQTQLISMGFMDTGTDLALHFHSSPRFLQVMSGVGTKGASMPQVWDTMRSYGVLPYKDLPYSSTVNPQEYFAPVSNELIQKAAQFLTLIGGKNAIQYHWIQNGGTKNLSKFTEALPMAPICLGIAVDSAGWNQPTPVAPPASQAPQHAVLGYSVVGETVDIYDHYLPFEKVLDVQYPIPYALQAVVTLPIIVEQAIVSETAQVVSDVTSAPISNPAKETLLQEIGDILKKVATYLNQ